MNYELRLWCFGLRAVDPHHVVRDLVLLLVDNSHLNSSNKLTRKLYGDKRAKRAGDAVIYRFWCDVKMTGARLYDVIEAYSDLLVANQI